MRVITVTSCPTNTIWFVRPASISAFATPGVAKALIESGREKQVIFVGHDVTVVTRKLLLQGVIDAVISQNPGHEARAAVRVLLALARGEPILSEQENIRIDIVMRDNLP